MHLRLFATVLATVVILPALHASVMYSFSGAAYTAGTNFTITSPAYLPLDFNNSIVPQTGELVLGGKDYGVLTSVNFGIVTFPGNLTGLGLSHNTQYTGITTTLVFNYNIAQDGVYKDTNGTLTIQSTPAVAPEPSSLLLLGSGLLGVVGTVRRRLFV